VVAAWDQGDRDEEIAKEETVRKMKRKGRAMVGPAFSVRVGNNEYVIAGPSTGAVCEIWARLFPSIPFTMGMCKDVEISEVTDEHK